MRPGAYRFVGMSALTQRRKPAYAITSVDNALRLLQMLRDIGEVRGKDAADDLGISPSTVHRLMSMLVYRGFAVQNESRVYLPGPAIGVRPAQIDGTRELQEIVRPHLMELRDTLQESAYFMILTGRVVRFLLTAESSYPTHAGDRHGFVIPAHSSAGGRAILSMMPPSDVVALYEGHDPQDSIDLTDTQRGWLHADLERVRSQGYAVSIEEVERGIVTVSAPIRHDWIRPLAAISVSGSSAHRATVTAPESIELLLTVRARIEREILAAERRATA